MLCLQGGRLNNVLKFKANVATVAQEKEKVVPPVSIVGASARQILCHHPATNVMRIWAAQHNAHFFAIAISKCAIDRPKNLFFILCSFYLCARCKEMWPIRLGPTALDALLQATACGQGCKLCGESQGATVMEGETKPAWKMWTKRNSYLKDTARLTFGKLHLQQGWHGTNPASL